MLGPGDGVRPQDDVALATLTGDLDPERTGRRHVERDLLAGEHALGPGVTLEHPAYRVRIRMPATTITAPATSGAMTQASPSRPR